MLEPIRVEKYGMKPKKVYEVSRFSAFILKNAGECNKLVDIGSGIGYLSQFLA